MLKVLQSNCRKNDNEDCWIIDETQCIIELRINDTCDVYLRKHFTETDMLRHKIGKENEITGTI
jgi:hypothetical protein